MHKMPACKKFCSTTTSSYVVYSTVELLYYNVRRVCNRTASDSDTDVILQLCCVAKSPFALLHIGSLLEFYHHYRFALLSGDKNVVKSGNHILSDLTSFFLDVSNTLISYDSEILKINQYHSLVLEPKN